MKIFMVMPTWNNVAMCGEAIRTLFEYTNFERYGELCVIDNSTEDQGTHLANICAKYGARYRKQSENLGWMRSINQGLLLAWATAADMTGEPPREFDLFNMCNDDVVFPQDPEFWPRTLKLFDDPQVMGVGPISNYVMGWQFHKIALMDDVGEVELLVGFCATYRTQALDNVGGLDEALPGGDDLDLSIRIRREGKLLCDRRSFLYHYGSVTGNRVHSDWDSLQSQHKTLNALIRKHGMKAWYGCVSGSWTPYGDRRVPAELSERIMAEVWAMNEVLIANGIQIVEGSAPPKQLEFLAHEARQGPVLCQVGLNAGHSAIAMLVANPEALVISYDLGEWECAKISNKYLMERYEYRHATVWGDSKETVPRSNQLFDFTFVDGGHDYETAFSDIRALAPKSKRVMVDDIEMPGVKRAWNEALALGWIKEPEIHTDRTTGTVRHWGVGRGGR